MEQTLDSSLIEENLQDPNLNLASGWRRFFNYIIDIIVYYFICFVVIFLLLVVKVNIVNPDNPNTILPFVIIILFGYYVLFEQAFGKTIGKMITKTKVVDENGSKPTPKQIMIRSLCRFIPFDAFTFLGSSPVGWHDSIAKTRVVNNKFRETEEEVQSNNDFENQPSVE